MQDSNQNSNNEILDRLPENQQSYSVGISNAVKQQILDCFWLNIKNKQLLTNIPEFTHSEFMALISSFIFQSSPNFGCCLPGNLKEQTQSQIIKISKDNLFPKYLTTEQPQKDQLLKPLDNLSSNSKNFILTKKNSLVKTRLSQITQYTQIDSGVINPKVKVQNNLELKSNNFSDPSVEKNGKNQNKCDPYKNFKSLVEKDQDDPEIYHLRQKAIFNQKEKDREQKLQSQRLKEEKQKIQSFKQQYGDAEAFTFDFEGEAIGSDVAKDQKISYYAMRFGVKTLGKKLRTIYKHLQSPNENKNQQTVVTNKPNQKRKNSLETSIVLNSSSELPVFSRQYNTLMQQMDHSKLKIIQYKKLYDKKFSRYDKNFLTLDLSSSVDKKITEEDIFTQKKHLSDTLSLNKSRASSVGKQYTIKKLALPKLKGKYKVLDKYDEL